MVRTLYHVYGSFGKTGVEMMALCFENNNSEYLV